MTPAAVDDSSDGVVVRCDVVHHQVDGFRPLALDLYVPAEGARALAVYLHGGGWRRGSRRNGPGPLVPSSARLFLRAARAGLAVASVDYRLSGEATYPAQCEDVDTACRYLDEHRGEFGLTGLPLVVWGVSAGGTLAALRALDTSASPPVVAAALWYAVTDLRTPVAADAPRPTREELFLGGDPAQLVEAAVAASPVARAHSAAPPFLLLHGDADDLVPPEQSERLRAALTAVGAPVTYEAVPGRGHMFAGMPDDEVDAQVDRTVAFLLGNA